MTAFFVGLGLELEGRMFIESEFVDTVIGIPDSRSEIVMLRPPDGGAGLELSRFTRPNHGPGSHAAMSNELGLRNVAFEVDDLQGASDRQGGDGCQLKFVAIQFTAWSSRSAELISSLCAVPTRPMLAPWWVR